MIKEGKVRYLGLSESTSDQIRRAHEIHPVSAVQIEYSLASRIVESKILPTTRELGISLVAYGALSRGLLTGQPATAATLQPGDFRNYLPRFSPENREQNSQVVNELKKFAESKGVTAAQLALTWVLHQGGDIITLVGTSKRSRLLEDLINAVPRTKILPRKTPTLTRTIEPAGVVLAMYEARDFCKFAENQKLLRNRLLDAFSNYHRKVFYGVDFK